MRCLAQPRATNPLPSPGRVMIAFGFVFTVVFSDAGTTGCNSKIEEGAVETKTWRGRTFLVTEAG